jgi:hypothetical protein
MVPYTSPPIKDLRAELARTAGGKLPAVTKQRRVTEYVQTV